jgi:hypothetical protein
MSNGLTKWHVVFLSLMFALVNMPPLQASEARPAAVYGEVPGKWTLNEKGHRDKFVPTSGYGKGVYAVQGINADWVLALDTDGEGFAECRRIPEGQGAAQPISNPNCGPQGPRCTAYPYKCSSELTRPLFIETNVRPTTSERLKWSNSINPSPAFKLIGTPAKEIRPFYFERSCKPNALAGAILFHGAWLSGPNEFHPGADESFPASVYDHYGRALYFRETPGIKLLSEPAIDFGEASAFERVVKGEYQWVGEPESTPFHDQPQYYPFHKIYTVPGGFWLEIDWEADFEGAGASTDTLILQVIDGKISEFTSAQRIRMY